jgi:hypothetical protein
VWFADVTNIFCFTNFFNYSFDVYSDNMYMIHYGRPLNNCIMDGGVLVTIKGEKNISITLIKILQAG